MLDTQSPPRGVHESIAQDAFPNGLHLRCVGPNCDRGERITSKDAARYLAHGWPTHCGQTMKIVNEADNG